ALLECDAIILPINAAKKIGSLAIEKNKIILEPPRVMFGNEKEVVEELTLLKEQGYNKIIANNIAHIDIANELGLQIIGGPFLNAANSSSVNAYQNCGVNEQILSFEMTAQAVSRINTLAHVGVIGYGYIPLMITKNCPIKNQMTCLECKKMLYLRTD
ncbi:MAG: U32 family peptidase, partial [Oscillospiraceae bacterium]